MQMKNLNIIGMPLFLDEINSENVRNIIDLNKVTFVDMTGLECNNYFHYLEDENNI